MKELKGSNLVYGTFKIMSLSQPHDWLMVTITKQCTKVEIKDMKTSG